jgi:hypothetical protein
VTVPPAVAALWRHRADLLTGAAFLAGWLLLTWGFASLPSRAAVWRLSFGVLSICLGGPRLLWAILSNGLYALTRPTPPRSSGGES